jgi:hypothetical protein
MEQLLVRAIGISENSTEVVPDHRLLVHKQAHTIAGADGSVGSGSSWATGSVHCAPEP